MNRALWPIIAAFTIWSVAFVALYALQALGCVWAWPSTLHRTIIIVVWLVTLGLLATLLLWQARRSDTGGTIERAGMWTTVAAIAATAVTFAPTLFVSLCL